MTVVIDGKVKTTFTHPSFVQGTPDDEARPGNSDLAYQSTKRKTINLLTNTTTDTETVYDPNSPNVFSFNTGGSNYFGRTDLTFTIGLTFKIK